jgi:hypothetical protein
MNALFATAIVTATLFAAIFAGRRVQRLLPAEHLSSESKDAVKFAMGMVATMTALLLGLLVSSAKSNYDDQRNQVIEMAAKVVFFDRLLTIYGPDAEPVRNELRDIVRDAIRKVWPEDNEAVAELAPNENAGDAMYLAIQRLAPHDDTQTALKSQALTLALELGQERTLLQARSIPSVSITLLVVVIGWLLVIFATSSMLAPTNTTTAIALAAAAASVAAAIFLILELDQPFSGMLHVSSGPMLSALSHLAP